eukprot:TRINITY_DN19672_c0_g1_i1.p1 TRINITY_DN19672_c0_g1~~TRINITY_DN19672_c0_g1_i1.p1  ORF type:complete len:374 (-),score=103.33 TRINITY_DN19672_c0_g1_i1:198-1319(-)
MAAPPKVIMKIGARKVELPVEPAVLATWGGMQALQTAAEDQLGLVADTYSFFDEYGKVDTDGGLGRAVKMAGAGDFELEVRELPQWARLRAMEEKLQSLTPGAAPSTSSSAAAPEIDMEAVADQIELAVTARVESALEELRGRQDRVEMRLNGSFTPLMERVSSEQAELRKALDRLSKDVTETVAPPPAPEIKPVETPQGMLALEQQMKRLCNYLQASQADSVGLQAEVHHTMATTNLELKKEMQCVRDASKLAENSVKVLKTEVRQLSDTVSDLNQPKALSSVTLSRPRPTLSAMEEDCGFSRLAGGEGLGSGSSKPTFLTGAYSCGPPMSAGGTAPFVRYSPSAGMGTLPKLESLGLLKGSQSLPQIRLRH